MLLEFVEFLLAIDILAALSETDGNHNAIMEFLNYNLQNGILSECSFLEVLPDK
jgi:hypothetical protein